jgi:integrase
MLIFIKHLTWPAPRRPQTKNLKSWLKSANICDGYLFRLIDHHGIVTQRPIYPEIVNNIVKKYIEACGLDPAKYRAHGLCRGFITECGQRNIGIELAMDLSGHKDYRTARLYYEQGKIMNNPATNL